MSNVTSSIRRHIVGVDFLTRDFKACTDVYSLHNLGPLHKSRASSHATETC